MKTLATFALATGLLCGSALAETVSFDDCKTGSTPPGWTASKPGKVDLWTKADSVTLFDDLTYGSK